MVRAGRGRDSFERGAWAEAFEELAAVDGGAVLEEPELERLAGAAYLIGRPDDALAAWARAHERCVRDDEAARAARCVFWLAFIHLNQGELARANGWLRRGLHSLDRRALDCVERGYLRYCESLQKVISGETSAAEQGFARAAETGDRFANGELVALALVGQGRCRIREGDLAAGLGLLDEAMAAGTADVSPGVLGDLLCTVIEGCQEAFDLRRAQEWTDELSRWCGTQPQLVLYKGQCLVHRAELMLLAGRWEEVAEEITRAGHRLTRPRHHPALGAAHYVRGDLHRRRGDLDRAVEAYREAAASGHSPLPGLALVWLAQGRVREAGAALRRALEEANEDTAGRIRLLGPYVEAALAGGDLETAQGAAADLERLAEPRGSRYLEAMAAQATGLVLLAGGQPRPALAALRRSWARWSEVEAPFEAAGVRLRLGQALAELGDDESAALEIAAGQAELARLGAAPAARASACLTPRELEVLRLLATGITNRAIARELTISERTVATHVSSVLRKLGLPSRTAATSYAHRHHLV